METYSESEKKEFFESSEYRNELHALARLCVKQQSDRALNALRTISVFYKPEDSTTGATIELVGGYKIEFNAGYSGYSEKGGQSSEDSFKEDCVLALGTFAHELSHFLKSSFKLADDLSKNRDFVEEQDLEPSVWKNVKTDILSNAEKKDSFLSYFLDFWNCIEDGYIERFFVSSFRGRLSKCLSYRRVKKQQVMLDFANAPAKVSAEENLYNSVRNEVLLYSLFGMHSKSSAVKTFEHFQLDKKIDKSLSIDYSCKRNASILNIFLEIFPLWKDLIEAKKKNKSDKRGESSSVPEDISSGSQQPSMDGYSPENGEIFSKPNDGGTDSSRLLKKLIDFIDENLKALQTSKKPSEMYNPANMDALPQNPEAVKIDRSLIEKMKSQYSNDCNLEISFLNNGMETTAKERLISSYSSICKKYESQISEIVEEVRPLIDYYKGRKKRNLYTGDRFNSSAAYRLDGKCFSSRKLPKPNGKLAVVLIVDMSGSMAEEQRYFYAREAAVVMSEFLYLCNIPYIVLGHTADCLQTFKEMTPLSLTKVDGSVSIFEFHEWSTDFRYGVSLISSFNSCNRDGMPLLFAVNKIKERKEPNKLIITISDGLPNAHGYSGEAARNDVKKTVRYAELNGIKILPAALGKDAKNVNLLYREKPINITKLEDLPVQLISFLSQYL